MIYPLNANRIERLDIDPIKKVEGYIWYNNVEQVYKTYVDGNIQIFITDKMYETEIDKQVEESLERHEFKVSFTEAYKVIIKHNKNNLYFNYNIYDTEENCNLYSTLEVLNENEISVEFVDPVTGYIFMYFA